MKPYVKNAADPEQVKEAEQKVKHGRDRELDDVYNILQTPSGRRFIWRYVGLCGVFHSSFTGNSTTFFKEGERNVGLRILAEAKEAHPEGYLLMQKESQTEERNNV